MSGPIRPIPVEIQHVDEHGALVIMAAHEYRTVPEQIAYLTIEGLVRHGYLPEDWITAHRPTPEHLLREGA